MVGREMCFSVTVVEHLSQLPTTGIGTKSRVVSRTKSRDDIDKNAGWWRDGKEQTTKKRTALALHVSRRRR